MKSTAIMHVVLNARITTVSRGRNTASTQKLCYILRQSAIDEIQHQNINCVTYYDSQSWTKNNINTEIVLHITTVSRGRSTASKQKLCYICTYYDSQPWTKNSIKTEIVLHITTVSRGRKTASKQKLYYILRVSRGRKTASKQKLCYILRQSAMDEKQHQNRNCVTYYDSQPWTKNSIKTEIVLHITAVSRGRKTASKQKLCYILRQSAVDEKQHQNRNCVTFVHITTVSRGRKTASKQKLCYILRQSVVDEIQHQNRNCVTYYDSQPWTKYSIKTEIVLHITTVSRGRNTASKQKLCYILRQSAVDEKQHQNRNCGTYYDSQPWTKNSIKTEIVLHITFP
ncbi:unnamed protein product [Mytilus edulis]|uniref:Uncharacterized protein n=1 Tax=Mytilus edulis TaxID=6550 RepID=A0A8S3RY27_MYTED|nr:unnamed protein product [Mytilus edulis]